MTTPTIINHGKYRIGGTHNNWACGSCGCRLEKVTQDTDLNQSTEGITIYAGQHGEPYETEDFTLAHVTTSAGVMTIGLRHEKFNQPS